MFLNLLARLTKNECRASLARKPKTLSFETLENRIMFNVAPVAVPRLEVLSESAIADVKPAMHCPRSEAIHVEQTQPIAVANVDSVFALFSVGILDVASQGGVSAPRLQKPTSDGWQV